ncbi:MAG: hypothetical protein RL291_477 [Pseudomonadota bacterium]|jgi:cell division septation protein DedD
MLKFKQIIAIAAVAIALPASAAKAQESGLSSMHAQAPVGNRICMTDHTHDGKGSGSTEAEARAAAARAWSSFTAWEYGDAWGSYALSANKRERCEPEFGLIACYFVSNPCRPRSGRASDAAAPVARPKAKRPPTSARPKSERSKSVRPQSALPKQRAAKPQQARTKATRKAPVLRQAVWTSEKILMTGASLR